MHQLHRFLCGIAILVQAFLFGFVLFSNNFLAFFALLFSPLFLCILSSSSFAFFFSSFQQFCTGSKVRI